MASLPSDEMVIYLPEYFANWAATLTKRAVRRGSPSAAEENTDLAQSAARWRAEVIMNVTMLGGHMEDQILENGKGSVQDATCV